MEFILLHLNLWKLNSVLKGQRCLLFFFFPVLNHWDDVVHQLLSLYPLYHFYLIEKFKTSSLVLFHLYLSNQG